MRLLPLATLLACTCAAPALAQTYFTQTQIIVSNNSNVSAASVNDSGDIAATVFNSSDHAIAGVIVDGPLVKRLPAPYAAGGPAYPQVIDNDGDVLGYAYLGTLGVPHMFLFRNGAIVPEYNLVLVSTFGAEPFLQPNPIGLAARKYIFYTNVISLSAPTDPRYGIPPYLFNVPETNTFQTAHGINAVGIVAGEAYSFSGPTTVFVGRGGAFTTLTPPGATSVAGGYINDAGQVAGSYQSASGTYGFVYYNGAYTTFAMPQTAQSIKVTALSSTGRVTGVYTTTDGMQHVFLYNGSVVSQFSNLPGTDNATVAINASSEMVVAIQSGLLNRSYSVACRGTGC